ncbi:MAG: thioredoxin-disulfide reductase [Methanobacteriaceae archaeon]|nr:thioredoxin-disulfide reductase [Methanobacteriaceae archaeon]
MEEYDVIIIGAGPAGLTAGIYAGREDIKALILEKGTAGGMQNVAPLVGNYPGFKTITGANLSQRMIEQASNYIQINELEDVKEIKAEAGKFILKTSKQYYSAQAIILCTGTTYRKLGAKGEDDFVGKGISYCSICDALLFKDRKVVVIGGGDSAVEHALHLNDVCSEVTIIHRRDELRAKKDGKDRIKEAGIPIIWNSVVTEINGDVVLRSIKIYDKIKDKETEMEVDGVFIAVGEEPNNQLAKELGVKLDTNGYIITDKEQKTNMDHVYAAGDITGGVKQMVVAAGEGAIAAISAYNNIK